MWLSSQSAVIDLRRSWFAVALGALLTVCSTTSMATGTSDAFPKVLAPEFQAQRLDDGTVTKRSDFDGNVILLNFWASWCFPCRYEMPLFQEIYDRYAERGLTVVAVAVYDELSEAKSFQDEYKFTFPVLFDDAGSARMAFNVETVPQTFLIGRDGILIPFVDDQTGESFISSNDPTLWEKADTFRFLEDVLAR